MLIKVNSNEFDSDLMNLVLDKRFNPLISFLISRTSQATTLRDIKREFEEFEELDRYIDELISVSLISRHHGRYQFSGKYVSMEQQKETYDICKKHFEKNEERIKEIFARVKGNPTLQLLFYLFKDISNEEVVIYEKSDLSSKWLSQPTRYTEKLGKKETFISMGSYVPYFSNNFADYFNFLTIKQVDLPAEFVKLRETLGDLNPTYFMQYCERKLRRLEKNKIISTEKSDIFMEALFNMGYVGVEESTYYSQLTSLSELPVDFSELTPILNEIVIEEVEMNFLVRVIFYNWLLEKSIIFETQRLHGVL